MYDKSNLNNVYFMHEVGGGLFDQWCTNMYVSLYHNIYHTCALVNKGGDGPFLLGYIGLYLLC